LDVGFFVHVDMMEVCLCIFVYVWITLLGPGRQCQEPHVDSSIYWKLGYNTSLQSRGSLPFSDDVPLQHCERWACTPSTF